MGIGTYRHRVTLEHPAVVLTPAIWDCAIQSAAGQVVDGLAAYFIRGRFHPGITLETQILFEGRTFQVQSVTDLDERHTDLQLMAVEVVGRGTTPSGAPVAVPPTITIPPEAATITEGRSVTLTVVATGAPPLFYQWLAGGLEIPGATNAFYVTGPLDETTAYAVRVSNTYGAVTSAPVTVTVIALESPLLTGLVSYWTMNETSGTRFDAVGSNHLTPTNAPGFGLGKSGNACDFEADSSQYLSHPDPTPLGNEDFTYALWFKRETIGGVMQFVAKDDVAGRSYFLMDNGVTGGIVFTFGNDLTTAFNPRLRDLNWHLLLAWHDAVADTINLQIDTTLVVTGDTGGNFPPVTATAVRIGARQYPGNENYFDGLIEEVGLWRRVLTSAERALLYNGGAGVTYPFS